MPGNDTRLAFRRPQIDVRESKLNASFQALSCHAWGETLMVKKRRVYGTYPAVDKPSYSRRCMVSTKILAQGRQTPLRMAFIN